MIALVTALALGAGLIGGACGGSAGGAVSFPTVLTLGGRGLYPDVRSSSLAVGPNRVLLGLRDNNNRLISDAQVRLRFYDLNGPKPVFSSAADTRFVSINLTTEVPGGPPSVGEREGVYVAEDVRFDRAGNWGVQVDVTRGGKRMKPIPFTFTVLEHSPEPAIGDPAPATRQPVLADVGGDDSAIDSSSPPRPAMHEITVADALKTGKPIVLAFATPAFCTTRTCGPMMENVMDPLYAKYHGQAIFIHIEPYDLKTERETGRQVPVPAYTQWNLQSEPWVFVIDRSGKIAAKFEGIASAQEVEAALVRVLPGSTPTATVTP